MHTNNTYQYGATDYIKSLNTPKHISRNKGWLLDKVSNAEKLKTAPDPIMRVVVGRSRYTCDAFSQAQKMYTTEGRSCDKADTYIF